MHAISTPLTAALVSFMDFESRDRLQVAVNAALTALHGHGNTPDDQEAADHLKRAMTSLERGGDHYITTTKAISRAIVRLKQIRL